MYDDIFSNDDHLNSILKGIQVEDNPSLQPIEKMFNDIFDPQTVKDKREFVKVKTQQIK